MTGRPLNLDRPARYTEKIQWRKLYDRNPLIIDTTDKLKVREYVRQKIGDQVLSEIYWVGEDPGEIPFDELPTSFVLKTNHGCGYNIFVQDQSNLDKSSAIEKLSKWLGINYGEEVLEWAYKHIQRRVYAEELLLDEAGTIPADYKFFVFAGKAAIVLICSDRHNNPKWDFYDFDWNHLLVTPDYPYSEEDIRKPANLCIMRKYAETLGSGFDFVRVDLYDLKSRVVFGEMTYYPGSGFTNYDQSYDEWLGSLWELPGASR